MAKLSEIDNDFKKIGEFGPYQLLVFVLVGLTTVVPALLAYTYIFISGTPEYRCKIPDFNNDTFEIIDENHKIEISKYVPFTIENGCYLNGSFNNSNEFNASSKYKCDSWVFSKQYYGKTIVSDWKLLCDDAAKKSTFSTLFFAGTYGVVLFGFISDKIGRKQAAYIAIIFNAIFSVLSAILLNTNLVNLTIKQILYGTLRFFTGITSNLYSVAVVLAIEITGPSKRVMAANAMYYFYILGEYFTVLLCYFVRDYDKIYIGLAAIMSTFVFYFWIVPESPRWLLAKGRNKEAYTILKRIANSNKRNLPDKYEFLLLKQSHNSDATKPLDNDIENESNYNDDIKPLSFLEAFSKICKSKKLLLRTISIIFNWLTNNLVYYGISLGTGQLAGNPYINFTLLATIELVAIITSQFAFERLGRKIPYLVNMILAGVSLLAVIFIPKSMSILITAMALIGKFTISLTYNGIYIITSEVYPTIIRTSAVSVAQAVARLGAVISPFINLLGELYWYPFPFIIYGGFAVLASVLTLIFVPETKGKKLPERFEDL